LQKRLDKLEREARANPKLRYKVDAAKNLIAALEQTKPVRSFPKDSPEAEVAAESFLLTAKPLLYVANIDEDQIGNPGPLYKEVQEIAAGEGSGVVGFCGKVEAELAGLSEAEVKEFCHELGIERGGLDQLIVSAYDLLGLMTFLTAGEKEVRAWTIERGTKAPQAAGKIHSDIERGFIRAEIVDYDDYVQYKTMDALRNAGLVRSEGKEYVMREGDVVNFKFNV
jgi:GTP-binding protein YchF